MPEILDRDRRDQREHDRGEPLEAYAVMSPKPLERIDYLLLFGVAAAVAVYIILSRYFPAPAVQ